MAYQPKSYRKFIATAAAVTVVAPAVAPVALAASFTDVPAQYEEAVAFLTAKGIQGTTETTFGTYENIKRVDAAVMLVKALGLDADAAPASGFTDVPERAVKAVNALKAAGITNGKTETTFDSQALITRGELAIWIQRGFKLEAGATPAFNDVPSQYANAVSALVNAEVTSGTSATTFGTYDNAKRGDFAQFLLRASKFEVPATATVVSVSAINASQLEIKFGTAVEKTQFVDKDGMFVGASLIGLKKIDGNGTVPTLDEKDYAKLSEDGKTLTITLAATKNPLNDFTYVATVDENKVKTTDNKYIEKFTSGVQTAEDTVAPTIKSTNKIDASTYEVQFSEPLKAAGTWTAKAANGNDVKIDATTTSAKKLAKGIVVVKITDADVAANTNITATLIGARDYADNVNTPNPTTVTITKGDKDGTAPTVKSITSLSDTEFEVQFSEEVNGFEATDLTLTNANGAGVKEVEKDKDDATKYKVTLDKTVLAVGAETQAITVAFADKSLTDLSGEALKAYSQAVVMKKDVTKPVLSSSSVKKDVNGDEYLHLVFTEEVKLDTFAVAANAEEYKDYVTKKNTLTLGVASFVPGTDDKEVKIPLKTTKFGGNDLVSGAKYTIKLTVQDKATNVMESTTVSFTRSADAVTTKPEVINAVATNNNLVTITFNKELDGTTATNKANYNLGGLAIKDVKLLAYNAGAGTQQVEVSLEDEVNTTSGYRAISVTNVKGKDGVVMKSYSGSIDLKENVKPFVKSAVVAATNQIKVTFSEDLAAAGLLDGDDFKVKIGSKSLAYTKAELDATDKDIVVITLTADLSADEIGQTISLESLKGATSVIKDAEGNEIKVNTVTFN